MSLLTDASQPQFIACFGDHLGLTLPARQELSNPVRDYVNAVGILDGYGEGGGRGAVSGDRGHTDVFFTLG